jgi:hypothetical protein
VLPSAVARASCQYHPLGGLLGLDGGPRLALGSAAQCAKNNRAANSAQLLRVMAAIDIEVGEPFAPDARMRRSLTKVAAAGTRYGTRHRVRHARTGGPFTRASGAGGDALRRQGGGTGAA